MARGRRERDRPKAPPGALYNPYKRVRLSYDSEPESEGEEEVRFAGAVGAEAKDELKKEIKGAELPDNGEEMQQSTDQAAGERDLADATSEAAEEEQDNTTEDNAPATAKQPSSSKLTNKSTGQWHALGSISWQDDIEPDEDAEEEDEAMAYLRSVRTERKKLPEVLVSVPRTGKRKREFEKFDEGHAFVGAPDPVAAACEDGDPREVYTLRLKQRFFRDREFLHASPSHEAVAALNDRHPISFPPDNKRAKTEWLNLLATTAPAPAQVRSFDEETVFRLLELLQEHFLQRQKDISGQTSAWIWSLLARLTEVGLMINDDVYNVRTFGKKAVLVLVSFRSSSDAALLEEIASKEAGAEPVKAVETEGNAANTISTTTDNDAKMQRTRTLFTLDAILVIVGGVYGQRDLLEFRRPWEASDAG